MTWFKPRRKNHVATGDEDKSVGPLQSAALAAVLIGLAAFSVYLAINRIFQVDELQNVFTARILARHLQHQYSAYASLMFFGPMMWLATAFSASEEILRAERILFQALFWLNLCLIVRCAGLRLRSRAGMIALCFAATVAPLWDYGFEIRHDNALLTLVLLAWIGSRPLGNAGRRRLCVVGFAAALAEFVAFKAFIYVIPIAIFALLGSWLEDRVSLGRSIGLLTAGTLGGAVFGGAVHLAAGTWSLFARSVFALAKASVAPVGFSAVPTLLRFLFEAPLLVVAVVVASFVAIRAGESKRALSPDSLIPELLLFLAALGALLANPTPFPYNLVLLVPQAIIVTLRIVRRETRRWRSPSWRAAFALAVLGHAVAWFVFTRRHIEMSNARQVELMRTAELLTGPADAVFDGAGLVPSRRPPGYDWAIQRLSIDLFRNGQFRAIRDQLAEGRTPVVIPNYRVAALPKQDLRFIENHYLPLAGDLYVAGATFGKGQHVWDCLITGRYYVGCNIRGSMSIDGRAVSRPAVTVLTRGRHVVQTTANDAWVVWVGPQANLPPALGPGRAADVFLNWY